MADRGDGERPMVRIADVPPGDDEPWPRSHGVYHVTVSMPIVAHSPAQARKRAGDMMNFLAGWRANEQGPHQASLYLYDDAEILQARYSHGDTYESREDIGISMYSDREFVFDWLDPESDAGYDPFALAEKTYSCYEDEEE